MHLVQELKEISQKVIKNEIYILSTVGRSKDLRDFAANSSQIDKTLEILSG